MTHPDTEIQTPAVITQDHVCDRPATDDSMRPLTGTVAWRKLTPLQTAHLKGQLEGGNRTYTASARYGAGAAYSKLFDLTEPSGTDSTQALNVCQSSRHGMTNDAKERAWDERLCIESHLSLADRTIVRMVCGEGTAPAKAVQAACNDYRHTVAARFRESLDNLIEAMETARRNPGRFNLARTG